MSSHQSNKDKPQALKCHHFCHSFDTHNFCPTCREAGKGDDPCVTFISPCNICASFTEEQMIKITHRKRYVKKQKPDTSKNDDELELLGDQEVESFSGSHADLESAADHLFTSPPRPQPLAFEALSLKTPAKSVPPTPGTALQHKIESKLGTIWEKSELKPTQVFSFMGYEYHLDSALLKPTQERWLKLQDLILRLKSKHVMTARCLMSLIGLLASTEKMVPEGRLHMRPFQFHLKEHWKYPRSLDSLLSWTEMISAHLDWWQNPTNVMIGADLHPKDHSIQLFTDASNKGWGAHLNQSSTKGLWSHWPFEASRTSVRTKQCYLQRTTQQW